MTTLAAAVPRICSGNLGTPRRGDGKDRRHRRDGCPQPDPDPPLPPRGLVDVGRGGCPDMLAKLFDRGLQLGGTLPLQPGDHADRDRQAQQVGHQLADGSFPQAIGPGQDAEDGPQPRAECPLGYPRRQGGTGGGATVEGRSGGGVGTRRRPGGRAAIRRLGDTAVRDHRLEGHDRTSGSEAAYTDHVTELVRRNQGANTTEVTGLPASFLARGRSWRASLDRRGVGRGRLGGVGRVLVEPFFQGGDPLLQGAHQREDSRLCLGRDRIPNILRKRRSIHHAAVLRIGSEAQYRARERLLPKWNYRVVPSGS